MKKAPQLNTLRGFVVLAVWFKRSGVGLAAQWRGQTTNFAIIVLRSTARRESSWLAAVV
jgi:hypothetical protein